MSRSNQELDQLLKVYIHDYLVKQDFQETAKLFKDEANLHAVNSTAIDAPRSFLYEWWYVFWSLLSAKNKLKHSDAAALYSKVQKINAREHQIRQQRQQLQLLQQQKDQLKRSNVNHPPPSAYL